MAEVNLSYLSKTIEIIRFFTEIREEPKKRKKTGTVN